MARKKQLIELEGLYYSDLQHLIKELTVGAYAYRNRKILKDAIIDGYECEILAEKYNLSCTRVKTIVRQFCDKAIEYRKTHG